MAFLQRGVNNEPLERQDKKEYVFSEYGIVKKPKLEKPDGSRAVEVARRLPYRGKIDHDLLVRNFGTVIQPEKEPEIVRNLRGKNEVSHESLIENFGR